MASTRVKVLRTTLISRLKVARERVIEEHSAEQEKARAEREELLTRLQTELTDLAALITSDAEAVLRRCDSYYRSSKRDGLAVRFPKLSAPPELSKEAKTHRLDRQIAVLENATDDVLSITAEDDYAKYL